MLLISVVLIVGGNVGIALIARNTGANLDFLHVAVSSGSVMLAMGCAGRLLEGFRFRKLQKAYDDPKFLEGLISYAALEELKKQARQAFPTS